MKNKRGITLIALVITIIVLLILSGVSISLTVGQNGILTKTQGASTKHTESEADEQIDLVYNAWKIGKLTGDTTELKTYLEDELKKVYKDVTVENEADSLLITILLHGKPYKKLLNNEGVLNDYVIWKENEDGTFSKEDKNGSSPEEKVTLKVGDYIAYDHTKDAGGNDITANTSVFKYSANSDTKNLLNDYTSGWQVLGLEKGKVQLISAQSVGYQRLSSPDSGMRYLNQDAAAYAKGKGAANGRCITAEDINKITGYDPSKTGNGEPYGKGTIREYGNEVTFYWSGNDLQNYKTKIFYTDGENEDSYNTQYGRTFQWYEDNGKTYKSMQFSQTATDSEEGREKITTVKSDYYVYYPNTLTENYSGEEKGIARNSDMYKLLFTGEAYWLASAYTRIAPDSWGNYYGLFVCGWGEVTVTGSGHTYSTWGVNSPSGYGFRPLITLSNNIELKKDDTHDGTTNERAYLIK